MSDHSKETLADLMEFNPRGMVEPSMCAWCEEKVGRFYWADNEEPAYCSEDHAIEAKAWAKRKVEMACGV